MQIPKLSESVIYALTIIADNDLAAAQELKDGLRVLYKNGWSESEEQEARQVALLNFLEDLLVERTMINPTYSMTVGLLAIALW